MNNATFIIMDAAGGRFRAVNYNAKKVNAGNAQLIYLENFGALQHKENVSKEEFEAYLQKYSARNERIKKPVFHAACSTKKKELSHEALKDIALEIMKHLGYGDNPILIFAHSDTENNHVHVVSSRVGLDGKKINDSYEKKRANHYLNVLLNKNPIEEFNLHLNTALTYKMKTVAQFSLLMERKGYTVKKDDEHLTFYKYGKKQGSVNMQALSDKIEADSHQDFHVKQLQALIYKYKKLYDSTLLTNHSANYTTAPLKLRSELTDFLERNFGLEFCFFVGKDKTTPYGYAIIDHQHKEVYKGSDILKLGYLIGKEQTSNATALLTTGAVETSAADSATSSKANSASSDMTDKAAGMTEINLFATTTIPESGTPKVKHVDDEDEFYAKRRRKR